MYSPQYLQCCSKARGLPCFSCFLLVVRASIRPLFLLLRRVFQIAIQQSNCCIINTFFSITPLNARLATQSKNLYYSPLQIGKLELLSFKVLELLYINLLSIIFRLNRLIPTTLKKLRIFNLVELATQASQNSKKKLGFFTSTRPLCLKRRSSSFFKYAILRGLNITILSS